MDYGKLIKDTREALGLFQKDLSNEHLSRNLLSNIELGKTNLMPAKALIIYKKCLEVAFDKQLPMTLNFDELLGDNLEYANLKLAYVIYNDLSEMMANTNSASFDMALVQRHVHFAKEKNIGMLRYFILELCGDLFGKYDNKFLQCDAYLSALGYLKWARPETVIHYFKTCYDKVLIPAYNLEKYDSLIHYLWILIDFQAEVYQEIDPSNYYNLGLFYKVNGDFDKASQYIDQYLNTAVNLKKSIFIDCNILKASMLSTSGDCTGACEIYHHILHTYVEDEFNYQKSICHSNTINCIIKNNVTNKEILITTSIQHLIELHDRVLDKTVSVNRLYSNIGQGYAYLLDFKNAKKFFLKSYNSIELDPGRSKIIELLSESYDTYIALDDVDMIIGIILNIDYSSISEKNRSAFMLLLLKLQMHLYTNELYSQYKNQFFEYLNKIPFN